MKTISWKIKSENSLKVDFCFSDLMVLDVIENFHSLILNLGMHIVQKTRYADYIRFCHKQNLTIKPEASQYVFVRLHHFHFQSGMLLG